MNLVRVTGTNYVRDTNSMGLINVDDVEKNDYLSKLSLLKTQKEEINKVKSEIDSIKNDVSEIKELMLQLLNKGSNG
jgi:hypothetical protein